MLRSRGAFFVAALLAAVTLMTPAAAQAQGSTATDANAPVPVDSPNQRPDGFDLTARQAEQIAAGIPQIAAVLRHHRQAAPTEYTRGTARWQVSWFDPSGREIAQVIINDVTGTPTEAWTGFQVAWPMARGAPGAFGHKLNHPWFWVPMCVLFVLPFLRLRRGRPTLLTLDLLMLLGFSISLAFFNQGNLGLSVPLAYPFLLYGLVRLLLLAFGRGRPREPLRLLVPVGWLAAALVALVGFRIWMNVSDSGVIDVGYAGVIGAEKIIHGHSLYGHWPSDNATGDTYGPVNYEAYVPFRAVFGWSGTWDDLPAGHAAAIAFDLLTLLGLFLLGRRVRGPTLGIVLAYAWAAYPFTAYALQSNSNDSLVAALIVGALLLAGSPPGRGAFVALAGMAKFVPFALAPLFAGGTDARLRTRRLVAYGIALAVTSAIVMVQVLITGSLHTFWHDTIVRQVDRSSPFSVWGLWGGLGVVQHAVQALAVALAIAVAFVPRRRTITEVAALAAAVMIAVELGLTHWFYLYIPWFCAPWLVATFAAAALHATDTQPSPVQDSEFTPRSPSELAAAVP